MTPVGRPVLVVRPEPAASTTVALLGRDGVPAIACPPSVIVPNDPMPIPPADAEAVVLTSARAAEVLGDALAMHRVYCVGDRTAAAAREAGASSVVSADGDGAALIALLRQAPETRLFHARGAHAAVDLAAALHGAGKRIETGIVYTAVAEDRLPAPARDALAAGRVGVIAVWSVRGAELFVAALGREAPASQAVARAAHGVAISLAVREPLAAAIDRVAVANAPTGPAMITAVIAAVSTV
ncbi:MAG: uroporphyrinogen-III synthase [Pseudomonadota bacterium]